jgi:hypothetical protein
MQRQLQVVLLWNPSNSCLCSSVEWRENVSGVVRDVMWGSTIVGGNLLGVWPGILPKEGVPPVLECNAALLRLFAAPCKATAS